MGLKDRFGKIKKEAEERIERGRIKTEQIRAEKLRHKKEQQKYLEPGTFRYGLSVKQNPIDFMKDVKLRREQRRQEKQKQK